VQGGHLVSEEDVVVVTCRRVGCGVCSGLAAAQLKNGGAALGKWLGMANDGGGNRLKLDNIV